MFTLIILFGSLVKHALTTPAPFYGTEQADHPLVKDSYAIGLAEGYTLEDHWHTIGVSKAD
jgi:hypothetical protein